MKRIRLLSAGILFLLAFCFLAQLISIGAVFSTANEISLQSDNGMHAWVGVLLNDHYQEIGKDIERVGFSALRWLALPDLFITALITVFLIQLFWLYFKGSIFEKKNTNFIRWVGWTVIAKVFVGVFYPVFLLVCLHQFYPDAGITKVLRINETDITIFLVGSIISVIGHVMSIGQSLKEEQELTI